MHAIDVTEISEFQKITPPPAKHLERREITMSDMLLEHGSAFRKKVRSHQPVCVARNVNPLTCLRSGTQGQDGPRALSEWASARDRRVNPSVSMYWIEQRSGTRSRTRGADQIDRAGASLGNRRATAQTTATSRQVDVKLPKLLLRQWSSGRGALSERNRQIGRQTTQE
jgi:hypothetical protein